MKTIITSTFKSHSEPTTPVAGSTRTTGSSGTDKLSTLPLDVLEEIISHFDNTNDTYNLSLTSHTIHETILPHLSITLTSHNLKTSLSRVRHLLTRPDIASRVREVVLRPGYLATASKKHIGGEEELARDVGRLLPYLGALERFVWDGCEVPERGLWKCLRECCPRVRHVGVNLGCKVLDPESELFSFTDLLSFSLTTELRRDKYNRPHTAPNFQAEELPQALWTMLIDRSPNLQTLVLGHRGPTFHSLRQINIHPLTKARWPNLHTLTIENASIYNPFDENPTTSFSQFIYAHRQTLKHLNNQELFKSDVQGLNLVSIGSAYPLHFNPRVGRESILQVALTSQGYCGAYLMHFQRYLDTFPNIRKLSIWVDLSEDKKLDEVVYTHSGFLSDLFEGRCGELEDLEVICSTRGKDNFHLQDLTKFLSQHSLPNLKRLSITKCYKSNDLPLKSAALEFARAKPILEHIVIRSVFNQWLPNSFDVRIDHVRRMKILQTGTYQLQRGDERVVSEISVDERGGDIMPWLLTKNYKQTIEKEGKKKTSMMKRMALRSDR